MCDPFSEDFDPLLALQQSPDKEEGAYGFENLEDFERELVSEQPEVAKMMCELDKPPRTKSKKQEKRERVARLKKMTIPGRELFEARDRLKERQDALDIHSQWSSGPMSLLYRSLKECLRIEVHIRALNRVDRVARGYLVAFDRHMNVLLKDVDEVAIPGRKEQRLFGRRKERERYLPPVMRWRPGGQWVHPIGDCRTVLQRHLPSTMIKGDTVVLFRLLD